MLIPSGIAALEKLMYHMTPKKSISTCYIKAYAVVYDAMERRRSSSCVFTLRIAPILVPDLRALKSK